MHDSQQTTTQNSKLSVSIVSPEEILYEGDAKYITCINKEGEFDLLPFHSNFISLIYKYIRVYTISGEVKHIDIGYALLKCMGNTITILTNVDISSYTEILTAQHSTNTPTEKK